jgi:hypothetical protein
MPCSRSQKQDRSAAFLRLSGFQSKTLQRQPNADSPVVVKKTLEIFFFQN